MTFATIPPESSAKDELALVIPDSGLEPMPDVPPPDPAEPVVDAETIGRAWAERNGYTLPHSTQPEPRPAEARQSAYSQAQDEAKANGISDPEWVSRRAFGLLEAQSAERAQDLELRIRLPEIERQFASEGAPKEAASYLPEAIQIASRLVPDRHLQEQLGRIIALGAHTEQQLKSAAGGRSMPLAETGAPAASAVRLSADQSAIARSLMRNFHPGETLTTARIEEFRKEGLL